MREHDSPSMRVTDSGCETGTRKKPLNRKRHVLNFQFADGHFAIDEDDYFIVCEMLLKSVSSHVSEFAHRRVGPQRKTTEEWERTILDRERSICIRARTSEITIPKFDEDIHLCAQVRKIVGISNSNNHERRVCRIGGIAAISSLDTIWAIPVNLGRLEQLQELDLRGSEIASLPPSIGALHNLHELDLSLTKRLRRLPKEIGNLSKLHTLNLQASGIAFLPPSLRKLKQLQSLDLSWTSDLEELPDLDDLAGLTRLGWLDLGHSKIVTSVYDPEQPFGGDESDLTEFLLTIVHCCQSIGFLGKDLEQGRTKLCYALACNRARTRWGLVKERESIQTIPKLWPTMLSNATPAFADCYSQAYPNSYLSIYETTYRIPELDAVYHLLVNGRESFVGVLVHRRNQIMEEEEDDNNCTAMGRMEM